MSPEELQTARAEAEGHQKAGYFLKAIAVLTKEQWSALSLRGRLKALLHGRHQAVAVRADQCHACGLAGWVQIVSTPKFIQQTKYWRMHARS